MLANTYAYVGGSPIGYGDPFGLASLTTDMTNGTTAFDPRPEDPNGTPYSIPTRNRVDSHALPGAADSYSTSDVGVRYRGSSKSYGPDGAYIDTADPRGRDIHGGGSCPATDYGNPIDPQQGWCPTMGCTRGQNQDVLDLAKKIQDFKANHPGARVPYSRTK